MNRSHFLSQSFGCNESRDGRIRRPIKSRRNCHKNCHNAHRCSPTQRRSLADLTVADVARLLRRSPGTVRDWIRRGELEAYQLGKEYRVTRAALTTFCQRQRNGPRTSERSEGAPSRRSDLGSWRKLRKRR